MYDMRGGSVGCSMFHRSAACASRRQLGVAGHAPHVARHLELLGQNLLRSQRLAQNRAAAEQLHAAARSCPASLLENL